MTWDVAIHLLGTRDQKGSGLERVMQTILDKMGYHDIRSKIHKTGAEIDLKARHKVTNQCIMVECKGHNAPVASNDIKKTYAEYNKELKRDSHIVCLFVSINGYEGTCKEWYDELTEQDKKMFLLWSGADLLKMLAEVQIVVPNDVVEYRINTFLGAAERDWHIVLLRDQLYWVATFSDKDGQRLFCVHDAQGHDVVRPVAEDIALEPFLAGATYVSLNAETALLSALLDSEWWSYTRLAKHLTESEAEVGLHANSLVVQHILEQRFTRGVSEVRLSRDDLHFAQVANVFLCAKLGFEFVSSPYGYIKLDESLALSLLRRQHIEPKPGVALALSNAFKISPSALEVALAPTNPLVERTALQLQEMRSAGKLQDMDINELFLSSFAGRLLLAMIDDLGKVGNNALEKAGIRAFSTSVGINMATSQKRYFGMSGTVFHALMNAKGQFEAGDVLSMDADGLIEIAGCYMLMEDYDLAEGEYRRAIAAGLKEENKALAYSNLGLCYYRQSGVLGPSISEIEEARSNRLEAAHNSFSKAIDLNPSLKQAWHNRALVNRSLGRVNDALSDVSRALQIDADYAEAQQLLKELTSVDS